MLHRPALAWTFALSAACLGLLGGPARTASADGLASFRLTNTNPDSAAAVDSVLAGVLPAGAVQPSNPSVSPLTILPGSTGFTTSDLNVSLGDGTDPSGNPIQALKLDFGPNGFSSGGVLNFALSLNPTFQGTLQLLLPPDSTGLDLKAFATTAPGSTTGTGSTTDTGTGSTPPPTTGTGDTPSVPEPISLAVWTGLLGLGLARARRCRPA